ncbi:MAG: amino acid-binding protein [Verrucomicrobiia bacterium]
MKIKQLSIFLENRPGALIAPCKLLANEGINIQTFALADTREFGILRIIVKEWEKARDLLLENGFPVRVTDLCAVEVEDRPGGLIAILEAVQKANVNVEYTYAFTAKYEGKGLVLFRFDNMDLAIEALSREGIGIIPTNELFRRLSENGN